MPGRMFKKAVQRGRSERGGEAYSVRYVEPPSDARTKLADFFNILLDKASPSGANPAYGRVHLVSRETIRAFRERRTTLLSARARFGAQAHHERRGFKRWAAGGAGPSRQLSQILYPRQPLTIWSTGQRVVEFAVGSDHSPIDSLG